MSPLLYIGVFITALVVCAAVVLFDRWADKRAYGNPKWKKRKEKPK